MRRFHTFAYELAYCLGIDARFAAFISAAGFGRIYTFYLALAPKVRFKFGEYSEHVEERFARGGASVDRLLRRLESDPPTLQLVHNILQIFHRPGEPVNTGYRSDVAASGAGRGRSPNARKMRNALAIVRQQAPDLDIDGEMHADSALNAAIRARSVSRSTLDGAANLLVMSSLDTANVALSRPVYRPDIRPDDH